MSKGDFVEVVYRIGDHIGSEKIEAVKSGRSVEFGPEKVSGLTWMVVKELTRGGTVVRNNQYALDQIVAIRSQIKSDE